MRGFVRPLALIALVLLIPIVPFVCFGDALEARIQQWLDPPPPQWTMTLATAALLISDIFLPVPASLVSTLAGAQLGIPLATAASWFGLTAGGTLGFALARRWGRPLAQRFVGSADLERLDRLASHWGLALVIVTRPLPVLAEATVLLLGTTKMAWQPFTFALACSNLAIALVYSTLGYLARTQGQLPMALVMSIALPLIATALARRLARRRAPVLESGGVVDAKPLEHY